MKQYYKHFFAVLFISSIVFISISFYEVSYNSKPFIYHSVKQIKSPKIALVLGTSKKLKNGQINQYFKYRIDATILLYNAGKIEHIIVSGDNSTIYYNEPREMYLALIKAGIPKSKITLDYAGFRTLDSVLRAKYVFCANEFIVISQKFHIQRAIFIARSRGIKAYGFAAKDVNKFYGIKTYLRELLAKSKALIDIFIFKSPKFYGPKECI